MYTILTMKAGELQYWYKIVEYKNKTQILKCVRPFATKAGVNVKHKRSCVVRRCQL